MPVKILNIILVLVSCLILSSCGIGGGGGDDSADAKIEVFEGGGNPARVNLHVEPRDIDAGDFMTVEVKISDITKPFILKIKHHKNLVYVHESMVAYSDNSSYAVITSPKDFATETDTSYLVETFFSVAAFKDTGKARVIFNFQAIGKAEDKIAVDVDEYTVIAPSNKFEVETPQFSSLASTDITVADETEEADTDTDTSGDTESEDEAEEEETEE